MLLLQLTFNHLLMKKNIQLILICFALFAAKISNAQTPTVPSGFSINQVAQGGIMASDILDGITADLATGNLYVAGVSSQYSSNFNLYKITPSGTVSLIGNYSYGHYEVVKMAFNQADGHIYTLDNNTGIMYKINPANGASSSFCSGLSSGRYGLNFDPAGNLIIAFESIFDFYRVTSSGPVYLGHVSAAVPNGNHGDAFGIQPNGDYIVYSDCGGQNNYAINTSGHTDGNDYPTLSWTGTTDIFSTYNAGCGYSNGAIDPTTGDVFSCISNFGSGNTKILFTGFDGGASSIFVNNASGITDLCFGKEASSGSCNSLYFVDRNTNAVYEVPMKNCCTPQPDITTVSGGGTYCGSTTITASGGTGGTIYFQGTTKNGTSTAIQSSSEVITTSGTYYFRAKITNGCWGKQGSVTVVIKEKPATPVITVSGNTEICDNNTGSTQLSIQNISYSDPITYSIPLASLVNTIYNCGNGSQYGNGDVGFSWNDNGNGIVTNVEIKFAVGVECGVGNHTSQFNGAGASNFTTTLDWCNCSAPSTPQIYTVNFSPNNYNVGGVNTYLMSAYYFGFIPESSLSGYYAQVKVTYGANPVLWTPTNETTNSISVTPTETTNYTVTVTGGNGCASSATKTISIGDKPEFTTCPSNIEETTSATTFQKVINYTSAFTGLPTPTLSYSFSGATTGNGTGNGSGSTFNSGITVVTLSATNSCGTKTCVFEVNIKTPATALNFDGSNDNVSINNTLANFGTSDFTIEMNVKTSLAFTYFLSKRGTCGHSNFISMQAVNGKLSFEIDQNSSGTNYIGISGTTVINDNQWHHIAVSRKSGFVSLYVDGHLETTANSNANLNNNYTLTLGASVCNGTSGGNGSYIYKGNMDEVRFWKRAVPLCELLNNKSCELTGTQTDLAAYYKFNQGYINANNSSVTTLTDNAGSNTGTLNNFGLSGTTSNWVAGNITGNCNSFTALSFTACPNNITKNITTGDCDAVINYTATVVGAPSNPTVTYAFTGATTGSGNGTGSGSTFNIGITTVTITAVNGCETVKCSFKVEITNNFAFDYSFGTLDECSTITVNWHGGCSGWNVNLSLINDATYTVQAAANNLANSGSYTWTLPACLPASTYYLYIEEVSRITWHYGSSKFDILNTAPTITTQASDKTVECGATGINDMLAAWLNNNGGAAATDKCGNVTWSNNYSTLSDGCGATGSATVTFTATDACHNASTTSATFTIEDKTAPTITTNASNSTVECDGSGNTTSLNTWLTNNGGAAASDACGGVTWTNNYSALSNDCGASGTATVQFTATDDCGNKSTTSATFTIEDKTAPTITTNASNSTVECDGSGNTTSLNTWLTNNGGAAASDACGGVTWTNNYSALSNDCGASGTATVQFTATDDCGNKSTTSATFTIEDKTAPTITTNASNSTVECDGSGNTTALNAWLTNNGGAAASDVCGGVTWTNDYSALSDGCGATGTATVQFTATDDCGNKSTTSAIFTIEDKTAPTITCPSSVTLNCQDNSSPASTGSATATDVCSGVSITSTDVNTQDANPSNNGYYNYTITRTWKAVDACGNSSKCDQVIVGLVTSLTVIT